jgi:hypothetical protein
MTRPTSFFAVGVEGTVCPCRAPVVDIKMQAQKTLIVLVIVFPYLEVLWHTPTAAS